MYGKPIQYNTFESPAFADQSADPSANRPPPLAIGQLSANSGRGCAGVGRSAEGSSDWLAELKEVVPDADGHELETRFLDGRKKKVGAFFSKLFFKLFHLEKFLGMSTLAAHTM